MTEIPNMTSAVEFGSERPSSKSFWRWKREPRNRHAKSARVQGTLDLDAEIKQRLEENELAGERLVNHIRLAVAILGGLIIAVVWSAQSPIARWAFATLVAGYAVFWAVMALLLRQPRYRPWLKYVATTLDLVWLFGLTVASLFNYSGVYETYRAPISWLLIAVFNALTALRLNPRLSLFAGCLTLTVGFTELALISHFNDVPWLSVSIYVGPGLHFGDVVQTVVFSALPAFVGVFVANYARRLVHESAQGAAARVRAEGERAVALTDLAEAREVADAKEQFLRVASHELRTPIAVLELATELLGETPIDNANRVDVLRTRIQRQATRLALLVDQLLDSSRLAGDRITLVREHCDLGGLCREVATDLDPTGKKIEIRCDVPVSGYWDPSRLNQVITNLLSNALRYNRADAVIAVVVRRQDDHAVLEVSDRGIGIAAEDLPHLFAPFFRSSAARKHDVTGLGLGLHIVNEIVRLHAGRIRVRSEVGVGTTFTVELPIVPDTDAIAESSSDEVSAG
jgi:signal transduction histidine kinase